MVDFTKPIEAVHTDGRVIPARYKRPAAVPGWVVEFAGEETYVDFTGKTGVQGWTIRNVAEQAAWRTSVEQLDRMDALVEKIARVRGEYMPTGLPDEARAILAAREPVDPDVAIAQQICDRSPYDLNGLTLARMKINNDHIREAVLAGIKYGRAQG